MYRADAILDSPEVQETVSRYIDQLKASGLTDEEPRDQFAAELAQDLPALAAQVADGMFSTLRRNAPSMHAEHYILRAGIERRIQWLWGDALDRLYEVFVICEELGSHSYEAHAPTVEESDYRFHALHDVHGRACLTASEIHALLRTGHSIGAYGRWRTLHELDVVASILRSADDDLARRFLMHGVVEASEDAEAHAQHGERSGIHAIPDDELEALRAQRTAALAEFGDSFRKSWHWAEPVVKGPNFRRLEEHAGLGHLRPHVQIASHLVHGGSRGSSLSRIFFRGGMVRLTGPSNMLLAEPGFGAAQSLARETRSLIEGAKPEAANVLMLASLKALDRLVEDVGKAFEVCREAVIDWENAYVASAQRGRLPVFLHKMKYAGAGELWASRRSIRSLGARLERLTRPLRVHVLRSRNRDNLPL